AEHSNSGFESGFFRTQDGGQNWEFITASSSKYICNKAFFGQNGEAWVVGREGLVRHMDTELRFSNLTQSQLIDNLFIDKIQILPNGILFASGVFREFSPVMLKSIDGGHSWEPRSSEVNWVDFSFADTVHGFGLSYDRFYTTNDGGKNWLWKHRFDQDNFQCLYFADKQEGWIGGVKGELLHTLDGGESWQLQKLGNLFFGDIQFLNEETALAVGREYQLDGARGGIYRSEDGGESWTQTHKGFRVPLWDSYFMNEQEGWVIGSFEDDSTHSIIGGIYHTTDGGLSWEPTILELSQERASLSQITFYNESIGWIIGDNATMLYTQDGGGTWTERSTISGVSFKDLACDPELGCWLVGRFGLMLHNNMLIDETFSEGDSTKIKLYPNPVQDIVTLEIVSQAFFEEAQIRLLDLSGRTVSLIHQGPIDYGKTTLSLDWDSLAAGYYTLSIRVGNTVYHRKVLKSLK
ncbi:MAG: YCF48-related protein, partial [Bacteroidota bacterium]